MKGNLVRNAVVLAALFFLGLALTGCSRDNPVAPQLSPGYGCPPPSECPPSAFCPAQCADG
jgi:hypothetical protein